jgi:hypothetical protein
MKLTVRTYRHAMPVPRFYAFTSPGGPGEPDVISVGVELSDKGSDPALELDLSFEWQRPRPYWLEGFWPSKWKRHAATPRFQWRAT